MDCKELMIGDWVRWKNKYVQVASISGIVWSFGHIDVTLAHCNDDHLLESHDLKSISPIPLTPEILEKNGWEKKGSPYEWRDNIWVQKWNLPIDTGNFQILDCPNYDGFTWNNIELKFVHTLQHALRLCGLNELADNFKIE